MPRERAVAGAEVVDRDPCAARAQLGQHGHRRRRADQGALGDLERQVLPEGVAPGGLDLLERVRLRELPGGDVDGHGHLEPVERAPGLRSTSRPIGHDQAGLLRELEPVGGQDQVAVVVPPGERLDLDDLERVGRRRSAGSTP